MQPSPKAVIRDIRDDIERFVTRFPTVTQRYIEYASKLFSRISHMPSFWSDQSLFAV